MNVPYVKVEEKVPWLQHTAEKYTYGQSRNEQTYCKKQLKKKNIRFFTRHFHFSPSIYHRLHCTVEICKICHILPFPFKCK